MLKKDEKKTKKQTEQKLNDEQLEKVSGGMIEIVDDKGNPDTVKDDTLRGDHQA